MHEPADARVARGREQAPRAVDVHPLERRCARLYDDPDQMNDDVGALSQGGESRGVR